MATANKAMIQEAGTSPMTLLLFMLCRGSGMHAFGLIQQCLPSRMERRNTEPQTTRHELRPKQPPVVTKRIRYSLGNEQPRRQTVGAGSMERARKVQKNLACLSPVMPSPLTWPR
jgi:hypothetical protein